MNLSTWEMKIIMRLRQARRAGRNVEFLVRLDDDKVVLRKLGKLEYITIEEEREEEDDDDDRTRMT